ncbi:MAG: response regulator transcription factor [Lachnospiraceae bacterium]|nr:response regulator transcription factor [Lachnospiraceae bacterium]
MYKIGICDDDQVLCAQLEKQICQISKEMAVKVETEVWCSGESIQNDLNKGVQLDLIFLDIELAQRNGIEVGQFIRNEMEDIKTHIVYISAKQNYAMQLFQVQPLDFLIKPVTEMQLKEVLTRSIRQKKKEAVYFEYHKGSVYSRLPIKDILYFMSMDKKIMIVTKKGREEFYGKLKEIAKQLPEYFVMIHQSYIVNQDFIREYSYETVKMVDGEELNISRPYRKELRDRIKQYRKERLNVSV